MAEMIYILCALTAGLCMLMLLQAYRKSGYKLLLWGGLCFLGFTLNNCLLLLDSLFPMVSLLPWRLSLSLASMLVLLYGLIWDTE